MVARNNIKMLSLPTSVLDYCCMAEEAQTEYQLYQGLEQMVLGPMGQAPLLVVSLPRGKEKDSYFRLGYGRKFFQESLVRNIVTHCDIDNTIQQGWGESRVEKDTYLLLYIGGDHQQVFFALFKHLNDLGAETNHFLSHFLLAARKRMLNLKEIKRYQSLAYSDDVTKLANQRKLSTDLEQQLQRADEEKEPLSVLFIDIDHFKLVNDNWGHLVGTRLLSQLGQLIQKILRDSDLVYRYGGDEFVALLPRTPGTFAQKVGERILQQVKRNVFKVELGGGLPDIEYKMSISIGVATYPDHAQKREDILTLADKMMYEAKKAGRGQVRFADEILGKPRNS